MNEHTVAFDYQLWKVTCRLKIALLEHNNAICLQQIKEMWWDFRGCDSEKGWVFMSREDVLQKKCFLLFDFCCLMWNDFFPAPSSSSFD